MITCTTADGVEVKTGDTVWIYNSGEIYPMEVGEILGQYKFAYVAPCKYGYIGCRCNVAFSTEAAAKLAKDEDDKNN